MSQLTIAKIIAARKRLQDLPVRKPIPLTEWAKGPKVRFEDLQPKDRKWPPP